MLAPAPAPAIATHDDPRRCGARVPRGRDATAHMLRELNHHVGNRALGRRLLQREPAVDKRPLELHDTYDSATRTIRRVETITTDKGDKATGRAPSVEEVYWVEFKVSTEGVMNVSARTVSPDGKARSPTLKLGTEFGNAIKSFKTKGVDVKAFDADWSYMSDTEKSTNLTEFEGQLKTNPKAGRDGAARNTPSGKIAVREGFTDVSVSETTMEKDPDIGSGTYPRVRARFARPGSGLGPISGGSGGTNVKGGGGSPPQSSGSTTKTSTRVGAGLSLAIMGANIALNWIIEAQNEKRMKESIAKLEPTMLQEQAASPTMGFLLIFRFSGGQQSADGPSASARFEGLTYRRGYTESEAKTAFLAEGSYLRDQSYHYAWIKPTEAPSPLELTTPFSKVGLAKFADISAIQFHNLEFAEWGGFGGKGLSTKLDGSGWRATADALRFLVLKVPGEIEIFNINRRRKMKDVDVGNASVKGGRVPAVMLDEDSPVVTVWPATDKTAELFSKARRISDKEGKLDTITNIDLVRWMDPDVVELVQLFEGGTLPKEATPS